MAGPGSPRSLASYATAGFVLFLFLMAAMQSLRQPPVPPPTRSRRPASHVAVPKDSKRSCNPYNFPGVLKLRQNSREPFENGYEWTVLGQVPPQCRPHGSLFRDFVAGNPHSRVRNRRVVILGDSVTRYVVQGICNELKEKLTVVELNAPHKEVFTIYNNTGYDIWRVTSLPHRCEMASRDFIMQSYFFYGLDEEELFSDKNGFVRPGNMTGRLAAMKSLERMRNEPDPDLVIVSSGLWDLARYQRLRFKYKLSDQDAGIDTEFLEGWIKDAQKFLAGLKDIFPTSHFVWQTLHDVDEPGGNWIVDGVFKASNGEINVHGTQAAFSGLRVWQMMQTQRALAEEAGIDVFPFGEVSKVQCPRGDFLHLSLLGMGIYMEMMLETLIRTPSRHDMM